MRVFFCSVIAAAVIAIGGAIMLHQVQKPAAVAFSTSAARI